MKLISLSNVLHRFPSLKIENPTGPAGLPFIGSFFDFTSDPLNFLRNVARDHEVAVFKVGPLRAALVSHPDHIQHLLVDAIENYPKSKLYEKLIPLLGQGLLTAEGAHWKKMRKIIAPSFHPRKISSYADIMTDEATRLIKKWNVGATQPLVTDLWADMSHITQKIVTRSLLGVLVEGMDEKIGQHIEVLNDITNRRFFSFFPFLEKFPLAVNRRYDAALKGLEGIIYDLIHTNRKKPRTGEEVDLLSVLLDMTDESGNKLTDLELRDEVMTFYLAGHETTANALTWMWVLLSRHTDWTQKLRSEINEVCQGRPPRYDDFAKLTTCKMVFEETMRLYPPIWVWSRSALKDDVIGGVKIPAGTIVMMSTWVTHRHPDFWDNAESFNPDRFGREASAKRHPYAYFPFSAGQRMCIGNRFALVEAVLIMATILQKCTITVTDPSLVSPHPALTLRSLNGVKASVSFLRDSEQPLATHKNMH